MSYHSKNNLISAVNGTSIGGFRNRIVNGGQRFDQRKVGTTTTASTFASVATTDKWFTNLVTSCAGTVIQQVTDAPTGFLYSNKITIGTGASPATGDQNIIFQRVEGVEVQDFNLGTNNAVITTFSFWVKSSVIGTYSVAFANSANNRTYLGQYTINTASTWEYKTFTFTVDVIGTWLTSSGTIGAYVSFDFGSGATYEGNPSTWQTGPKWRVSTNAKPVATSSATFQFTGVQWEIGPIPSIYEQIPYQVEYARCQRYYDTSIEAGATITTFATMNASGVGGVTAIADAANGNLFPNVHYHVPMASNPTLTVYSGANRTAGSVRDMETGSDVAGFPNGGSTSSNMGFSYLAGNTLTANRVYGFHYTADAGL